MWSSSLTSPAWGHSHNGMLAFRVLVWSIYQLSQTLHYDLVPTRWFISWGCYNKWPPIGWVETTEIGPLTGLETKIKVLAGCTLSGGSGGEPIPHLFQLPAAVSPFLGLWPHTSLLHLCSASPMCLGYVLVSLIKILVVAFRADHSNPGWSLYLRILNFITSAKSLFPKKVILHIPGLGLSTSVGDWGSGAFFSLLDQIFPITAKDLSPLIPCLVPYSPTALYPKYHPRTGPVPTLPMSLEGMFLSLPVQAFSLQRSHADPSGLCRDWCWAS